MKAEEFFNEVAQKLTHKFLKFDLLDKFSQELRPHSPDELYKYLNEADFALEEEEKFLIELCDIIKKEGKNYEILLEFDLNEMKRTASEELRSVRQKIREQKLNNKTGQQSAKRYDRMNFAGFLPGGKSKLDELEHTPSQATLDECIKKRNTHIIERMDYHMQTMGQSDAAIEVAIEIQMSEKAVRDIYKKNSGS